MKREIKFRGKRPNSGKWILGYPFISGDLAWILSDRFSSPECSCEVLTETVGQFIGLHDKNGKEIFEGDILKYNECVEEPIFFQGLAYIDNTEVGGNIKIIRCDNVDSEIPMIKGEECLDSSSFWNDDFEVIGNIYESDNLLK